MFTDVNIDDYDLNNDFHRARFFRDCLKGDIVFALPAHVTRAIEDTSGVNPVASCTTYIHMTVSKGPECSFQIVKLPGEAGRRDYFKTHEFLYYIMLYVFGEVNKLLVMFEAELEMWGLRAGKTPIDEWLKNNPFKFSKNTTPHVLHAFKKHFSTEDNILKTLKHLYMIIMYERNLT